MDFWRPHTSRLQLPLLMTENLFLFCYLYFLSSMMPAMSFIKLPLLCWRWLWRWWFYHNNDRDGDNIMIIKVKVMTFRRDDNDGYEDDDENVILVWMKNYGTSINTKWNHRPWCMNSHPYKVTKQDQLTNNRCYVLCTNLLSPNKLIQNVFKTFIELYKK